MSDSPEDGGGIGDAASAGGSFVSRTRLRYLLNPSKEALFDPVGCVDLIDLSAQGARIRHSQPLKAGAAGLLSVDLGIGQISSRAFVIWSQRHAGADSGRTPWASGLLLEKASGAYELLRDMAEKGTAQPIQELREFDRYVLKPSAVGKFSSVGSVIVRDISERGARIEQSTPVKPGSRGTFSLSISNADLDVAAPSVVAWSQIVRGESVGISYQAGLHFIEPAPAVHAALPRLVKLALASVDLESLFVRKQILRAQQQTVRPLHTVRNQIDPEHLMLIRHVRSHLKGKPEQVAILSQRVRSRTIDPAVRESLPEDRWMREEILAIWEYLERTIDLRIIANVVSGGPP